MTFSGALTITDLDDFLTPSQACIIPVRNTGKIVGSSDGATEIEIDANNNYYEVSTFAGPSSGVISATENKHALKKAEISLNDCLACSGCITSTESLLITLQSHAEVLTFINDSKDRSSTSSSRTPVLSISPQTLASLSASCATASSSPPIPLLVLLRRIRSFLARPENGGWRVWDTTFSRDLSLRETVAEFQERQAHARGDKGKGVDHSVPLPGPLPMLASACPGWVCYAEKAQGDLLPLLSAARSSQGIIGGLVKTWWAKRMGLNPDQIYHVTAMPCYDKKLEASRSDFYSAMYSTRDVDCVLTTGELDLVLTQLGFDPSLPSPLEEHLLPYLNPDDRLGSPWPEMIQHPGSSSGSYLHTLLTSISRVHPNPTRTIVREIRGSSDNVEYLLEDTVTGDIIFKGAKCYGFRNLQNLVRKVNKETGLGRAGAGTGRSRGAGRLSAAVAARRRKARTGGGGVDTPTTEGSDAEGIASRLGGEDKKLDFVEVMACPGGCVNGGGQLKPVAPGSVLAQTEKNKELDEEGYERPLADDGVVSPPSTGQGVDEGMRWSTKEWVAKVESIYWMGYPTPPASCAGSENGDVPMDEGDSKPTAMETLKQETDRIARMIIEEVSAGDASKRWEFLRTRFRKVEGDVLGGGLTHDAVKW